MHTRNLTPVATISQNKHFPMFLIAASALVVGIIATWNGISISMDSAWYLRFAQSIRADQGLSAPITSYADSDVISWIRAWPPLYPMMLALGSELFSWARVLSVVSLVLSALLTYALGLIVTGHRRWISAIATILFLSIPTVTSTVFAFAHSEAPFTAMVLAVLLLMTRYRLGETASMRPALYAAGLTTLALLTRYIGVALGVCMLAYSIFWARSVRHRLRWFPALMFALSFLPLGLYVVYLWGLTSNPVGVQTVTDPFSLQDVPDSLRQVTLQLLHGLRFAFSLVGIRSNWFSFLLGLVIILVVSLRLMANRQEVRKVLADYGLLGGFVVSYLLFFWVLAARSDPIWAEGRHFVVIYPPLAILLVHFFGLARVNRFIAAVLLTLYVLSGAAALIDTSQGLGYNAPKWRDDPLLATLPDFVPADSVVHGQDVGYLALRISDTPIRMFGGDSAFMEYSCQEIVYPPGRELAIFTLMDSPMLENTAPEEIGDFLQEWASPCGTVEAVQVNHFTALLRLRVASALRSK